MASRQSVGTGSAAGGIARNLLVAAPWLLFAGSVLGIFWAYGAPSTPAAVDIPGVLRTEAFRGVLWIWFVILTCTGAVLRFFTSRWFPQLRFDFGQRPIVTYDVRTGAILDVQRFDLSNAFLNFGLNRILAFFAAMLSWSLLEVCLQINFVLRTLGAAFMGDPLPQRAWPARETPHYTTLSYIAFAAALAMLFFSMWRVQTLAAQPRSDAMAVVPSVVESSALEAASAIPAPTPGAAGSGRDVAVACGTALVVDVDALILRAAPSTEAERLRALPRGERVEVLCTPPVAADAIEWRHVRYDGVEGWMSGRYLAVQP